MLYWSTRRMAKFDARSTFNRMISHYLTLIATDELKIFSFGGGSLWGTTPKDAKKTMFCRALGT